MDSDSGEDMSCSSIVCCDSDVSQKEKKLGEDTTWLSQKKNYNIVCFIQGYLRSPLRQDIISALITTNCFDIVARLFTLIDAETLYIMESVCKLWRFNIVNSNSWKIKLVNLTKTSSLWRGLAIRRGWQKYLDLKCAEVPYGYFRKIYWQTLADIQLLNNNWKYGRIRSSSIKCGADPPNLNGVYCFSYDDEKLISGHRDQNINIWDLKTLECKGVLTGHLGSVLSLCFEKDVLVSGSSDSSMRVWDLRTLTCKFVAKQHYQSVLHVMMRHSTIISSSKDKSIIVWDLDAAFNLSMKVRILGHLASVNAVEFDARYIVSASGDSSIRVWRMTNFELVHSLTDHIRGIACINYKYPYIISGSADSDIKIWNADTGKCLRTLHGHNDLVRCIRFDSRYIISGSYDGQIRIWSNPIGLHPSSVPVVNILSGDANRVYRIQLDEFQFISSSQEGSIIIWNFLDQKFDNPELWKPEE